MKVLELFAGTRSIGKAFEAKGHEVFSVEWDKSFDNIDLYADIGGLSAKDILKKFGRPDVIWASPDCTTYSIAAISHHRKQEEGGNLAPVSEYAKFCDKVNKNVLDLIAELKPRFYFIENPRGGMRKMDFMKGLYRYSVTYCQYGDKRMKPTDISAIFRNHYSNIGDKLKVLEELGLIKRNERSIQVFKFWADKHDRNSDCYKQWRKDVYKRDGYKCQVCGTRKDLQAHHKEAWKNNKERRYDVDNGITLCRKCHLEAHGGCWKNG